MYNIGVMLKRLAKYYWSPEHPRTYLLEGGNGIGNLASQSYGAFNLLWAQHDLRTTAGQLQAMAEFPDLAIACRDRVQGVEVCDVLTLLPPSEVAIWYAARKNQCSKIVQRNIERALDALRIV